jgi:hypothetical protein
MSIASGKAGMGDDAENVKTGERRQLSPAARRALAEAEARRAAAEDREPPAPREVGGREGPDPARYGDWEVKGIASDF